MPGHEDAGGIVSLDDIARLAVLFDRCEHAFDPTEPEAASAGARFEEDAAKIWRSRVQPVFPTVDLAHFRAKVRTLRRQYLKKNRP